MRFIRSLSEGDRFRVANPSEMSSNHRSMPRERIFLVKRIFSMSPHMVIAVAEDSPEDGFYSIGPDTPVISPKEFDPTQGELTKFETRRRTRVVGYRLLWDGKLPLSGICYPSARALLKFMFAMGKRQYGAAELGELLDRHYFDFLGKKSKYSGKLVLSRCRRHLVDVGLIEEVVELGSPEI